MCASVGADVFFFYFSPFFHNIFAHNGISGYSAIPSFYNFLWHFISINFCSFHLFYFLFYFFFTKKKTFPTFYFSHNRLSMNSLTQQIKWKITSFFLSLILTLTNLEGKKRMFSVRFLFTFRVLKIFPPRNKRSHQIFLFPLFSLRSFFFFYYYYYIVWSDFINRKKMSVCVVVYFFASKICDFLRLRPLCLHSLIVFAFSCHSPLAQMT